MRLLSCLLAIIVSAMLFSCKKDTSWDVDAAIPIAQSKLNMSNFFGDSIFSSDPAGTLHINFSKELLNFTMDSLVKLPDTTVNVGYTSFFTASLSPGQLIFSNNISNDKEITFDVTNSVELNRAIIKKGTLKVEYNNTYTQPLYFDYYINSATLWGNPLHVTQLVPANTSGFVKYYALDGYNISLTGLSQNKVNTLVQTYTISTDPSGQPDQLQPGQGLNIKLSFADVVPEYVQGYFGQQNLTFGPDSSAIGLLGNFTADNLVLSQAAFNFRIINEFGIEMTSSINSVKSIKTNPLNIVSLNSGNLLQSINVNRASKTNNPSNPVFPWIKQININSGNSNLNPFIENLPNYLGYSLNATINPLGNISAGNDFAYYGRGLKVYADIDIPLALSANYFSLVSYSKVDLTQLRELDNVNHCEIILNARNNYPFRTTLQGYMLDEQGQVIDSLFIPGQNYIEQAVTDINNVVLHYTDSKLIAAFDHLKIENLKKCKQIKFVTFLYLPNQPTPISIKEDSYLDLVISANINYNVRIKR